MPCWPSSGSRSRTSRTPSKGVARARGAAGASRSPSCCATPSSAGPARRSRSSAPGDASATVEGDRVHLGMALDNLIANGLEHGGSGVSVVAREGRRRLHLEVVNGSSDGGPRPARAATARRRRRTDRRAATACGSPPVTRPPTRAASAARASRAAGWSPRSSCRARTRALPRHERGAAAEPATGGPVRALRRDLRGALGDGRRAPRCRRGGGARRAAGGGRRRARRSRAAAGSRRSSRRRR